MDQNFEKEKGKFMRYKFLKKNNKIYCIKKLKDLIFYFFFFYKIRLT